MKPLVFLGSGISMPSFDKKCVGYASVESLTKALFDGAWFRVTTGDWQEDASHDSRSPYQPPCQEFLRRLRKRTEDYYLVQRGSLINYEDLYSLIQQIMDEAGWRDNAAIKPFRIEMDDMCADLYKPGRTLENLARETIGFIQHVIATKLGIEVPTEGLKLLKEMSGLPGAEPLTICTLNHDLLVESFLKAEDVSYTDGFLSVPEYGIRYFDPDEFARKDAKVKLLKLHGSINWWQLDAKNGGGEQIGIRELLLWDNCRTRNGKNLYRRENHPLFLTGSDKLAAYQSGIFLAQMREFERALDEHDLIVMSGYGWGDKGINIRLKSWVFEKEGREIILLHKTPNKLTPRRALQHSFRPMVKEKKLILIRKWMCDVDAAKFCQTLEKKMKPRSRGKSRHRTA